MQSPGQRSTAGFAHLKRILHVKHIGTHLLPLHDRGDHPNAASDDGGGHKSDDDEGRTQDLYNSAL